MTTPNLSL